MRTRRTLIAALALAAVAESAAAQEVDPSWPCQQRKVEELSLALMWPLPIDPDKAPGAVDSRDIAQMGELLALRRVNLEEAKPQIEDFAERHAGNPQIMGRVFAHVFDSLGQRRTRIIHSIEKFADGQDALSGQIDATRTEIERITALPEKTEADYDKADRLEVDLDWAQTIFNDRQKSITYLCETPVLIERRLFDIAQLLVQETHVSQ